jgi:hypothetical protein
VADGPTPPLVAQTLTDEQVVAEPAGMPPFPGLDSPDPLVRQCAEELWYGRPDGRVFHGALLPGSVTLGWSDRPGQGTSEPRP